MSGYLRHILTCNSYEPADYLPFLVDGSPVGRVRRDLADKLAGLDQFEVGPGAVVLTEGHDFASRSAALKAAVAELVARKILPKQRKETFGVAERWGGPWLAKLDRAAVPLFGVRAYGVHLNGYVRARTGLELWVGIRARDKEVAPGQYDNLVAGGQPYGLSLADNLAKECAEEADIPGSLAAQAVPVSAITYTMAQENGLRADTLFCWDLELDEDFVPRNTDGEIEYFERWPLERVASVVRETDDFKFNVNLVIVDFLIRHGAIGPEQPDYLDLVRGLHQ